MEPAMLTITEIAGFAGAGLAGAAYIPQISHLIRARCSAGISRLAFEVWLLASLLTTVRAIAIHAGVFIVLGGIQIVATTVIMIYATRYKNTSCPIHHPRQPGVRERSGSRSVVPGQRRPRPGPPGGSYGDRHLHDLPSARPLPDAIPAPLGYRPARCLGRPGRRRP